MPAPIRTAIGILAATQLLVACGGDGTEAAPAASAAGSSTYTVSGLISGLEGSGLVLVNNGGERLPVTENGPFRFTQPLGVGVAYAIHIQTGPQSPMQTCEVTNGSGSGSSADVRNVVVTCTTRVFAYVTNPGSNTVSTLNLDRQSGALAPSNASPYHAKGTRTVALAFEPSGRFGYSIDQQGASFHALRVDERSGELSYVSSLATGAQPDRLAMDPLGRFVYVSNSAAASISIFRIDAAPSISTETPPTHVGGFPFSGTARDLIVDPTGRFLYVAFGGFEEVRAYAIDERTGRIAEIAGSPFPIVGTPSAIALDRAGTFLYTVNESNASISAFSRHATTGALTPLAGSPFVAVPGACGMAFHPSGNYAFVANRAGGSSSLSTFAKAADGALAQVAGSPVPAGSGSCSVAVDATQRFVYVVDEAAGSVSGYSLDAITGRLTPLAASPFPAGMGPGASTIVFR